MGGVRLEPGECLTAQIEQAVWDLLGPVSLQTDFRRDASAVSDATVLIRAPLDKTSAAALAGAFNAAEAVESARVSKQKLAIRFTDAFMDALVARRLAEAKEPARPRTSQAGRRVVVDFCDPNANKALHIGHLRNVALGAAIAGLWRSLGAAVECQSVVCDIGRNVAEALAGLKAAGGDAAFSVAEPLAPRLGRLYADYVAAASVTVGSRAEADAPIERELARHDDAADALLDRWRAGDADVHRLWAATIARVLDEQAATLAPLGIGFDRHIRESSAVSGGGALAEALVARGLAFIDADGTYVLETGRADYPRCPLTRSDGFPTEHLRALVLWDGLRDSLSDADVIVHVMGQEWRTSTEIRLEALEALRETGFPARYRMLPHRLVRLAGSDMKSSRGDAILIDELREAVEVALAARDWYNDPDAQPTMSRACLLAPMLESEPEETLDFTMQAWLDPLRNPGFRIARALGETRAGAAGRALSPEGRYLVLQVDRLERMIETAALKCQPALVLKHVVRLADDRLSGALPVESDALLRTLMLGGLAALGWHTCGRGE